MCEVGTPIIILAGSDGLTKAFFGNVVLLQRHVSWSRRKSTCAQRVVHKSSESDTAVRPRTEHHRRQTHKGGTHILTENVYEESPVGDSNSNGSIERQIRAIKDYTEPDRCDNWFGQLSLEMACTTCSVDIDDVACWQ